MSRPIKSNGRFQKGHPGLVGSKNPMWKGDLAGYEAKHERIYVRFGQPKKCDDCGTETAKKYEWANLSGQYKSERSDWKRLCVSCHRLFDGHGFKVWKTRRAVA